MASRMRAEAFYITLFFFHTHILKNAEGTKYIDEPAEPHTRFMSRIQALSNSSVEQGVVVIPCPFFFLFV